MILDPAAARADVFCSHRTTYKAMGCSGVLRLASRVVCGVVGIAADAAAVALQFWAMGAHIRQGRGGTWQ